MQRHSLNKMLHLCEDASNFGVHIRIQYGRLNFVFLPFFYFFFLEPSTYNIKLKQIKNLFNDKEKLIKKK